VNVAVHLSISTLSGLCDDHSCQSKYTILRVQELDQGLSLLLSNAKVIVAGSFSLIGVQFQISIGAHSVLKSSQTIFGTLSGFASLISCGSSVAHFGRITETLSVSIFHNAKSVSLSDFQDSEAFMLFSYFHSVSQSSSDAIPFVPESLPAFLESPKHQPSTKREITKISAKAILFFALNIN
jgi:hypothetical protein